VHNPIALFSGSPTELIVVLVILLLLFGSTKLPKLARGLGASVTEFRKGLKGEADDEKKKLPDEPAPHETSKDNESEEAKTS